MRTVAAICLAILISAPAFASDNLLYDYYQRKNDERAAKVAASHRRYEQHKALCAKIGGARVGLNAEGVLKSCWGRPAKVNETATAGHSYEQWVYSTGDYLYLTDGLVTAIQTHR
jgi:hypothetical protein